MRNNSNLFKQTSLIFIIEKSIMRSYKDLQKSNVEKGDLILRVDSKDSAFLTVFDKFQGASFKGMDFGANLAYWPTTTLGKIAQIEIWDYDGSQSIKKERSRFYYGGKAKIAQALVREGFEPHAQALFPNCFSNT